MSVNIYHAAAGCLQDEKSQTVTSHIWLQMVRNDCCGEFESWWLWVVTNTFKPGLLFSQGWVNEFLRWTPSDFCGIDIVSVPTSLLWIPDISIQEEYVSVLYVFHKGGRQSSLWMNLFFVFCGSVSDTGSIHKGPLANVYAEGWVLRDAHQRLSSSCKLNLGLFPFDTQICNFTFGSLSCDGTPHSFIDWFFCFRKTWTWWCNAFFYLHSKIHKSQHIQ